MSDLQEITIQLQDGDDLSQAESMDAAEMLTEPGIDLSEKKEFLVALHKKGESVEEVTAFAKVFRQLATDPKLSEFTANAIDIVGTGGSGSKGFNISSTTAFILAAAGIRVLKHGNRAITSQSGAADFLGQHGIRMDTDPEKLRAAVKELNFCFFFAPAFHPAFKEIMPVRMALAEEGQRTIFNILGPLINPAKPAHQLLGVFQKDWVKPLAGALDQLGLNRGLAVCSELPGGGFMDEFTTAGSNRVCGFGGLSSVDKILSPDQLGFPPADPEELKGGTAEENVALLEAILDGKGRPGLVDTIVLNAACAFLIMERVESIGEGCALARETLLSGDLRAWLTKARAFYRDTGDSE
ncbi:MAG: anthranilate phosphoribosyltransferase [Puniceicoccaceae bacterium]